MDMQCTSCHKTADFSPLRLGKMCGQCKMGTWIPGRAQGMKDQNGKEITREFAPNHRDPADKSKVTVVPSEPTIEITTEGVRPVVVKKKP